jgi:hypothetical protein
MALQKTLTSTTNVLDEKVPRNSYLWKTPCGHHSDFYLMCSLCTEDSFCANHIRTYACMKCKCPPGETCSGCRIVQKNIAGEGVCLVCEYFNLLWRSKLKHAKYEEIFGVNVELEKQVIVDKVSCIFEAIGYDWDNTNIKNYLTNKKREIYYFLPKNKDLCIYPPQISGIGDVVKEYYSPVSLIPSASKVNTGTKRKASPSPPKSEPVNWSKIRREEKAYKPSRGSEIQKVGIMDFIVRSKPKKKKNSSSEEAPPSYKKLSTIIKYSDDCEGPAGGEAGA